MIPDPEDYWGVTLSTPSPKLRVRRPRYPSGLNWGEWRRPARKRRWWQRRQPEPPPLSTGMYL